MKRKINRHTIRTIAALPMLLLLPMLAGCGLINEPGSESCTDSDDISVSFRLITGNVASRAVDELGSNEENHIDPANLKILIFDENRKLKQVVYDNGSMPANTSFEEISVGYYILRTKLDPQQYNTSSHFAIVALANWKNDNAKFTSDWQGHTISNDEIGTLTIDDLKEMVFTLNPHKSEGNQPDSWMPGPAAGWIPMFGSRYTSLAGYDRKIFNEGNPMPIPDVLLVRAISKIEVVNLDTDVSSPEITSITLAHRNQAGRLMQEYTFTGATQNVSATTLPSDLKYTNYAVPFHKQGNKYSIYLPEMELNGEDQRRAICVNLNMNGSAHQKWIYLAPYDAQGKPVIQSTYDSDWDAIKRNYIYQYTINSLAFEFIISVEQWKFGGKVHISLE